MKAEDLFPNALVFDEDGDVYAYDPYDPKIHPHRVEVYDEFDQLKPIPLTAEILKDWFGSEFSHHTKMYHNKVSIDRLNKGKWRFMPYFGEETIFEFVHEFQRIYHAMTGKPLKRIDI